MSDLIIIENYQDRPVEFRRADRYMNLTALCRTFGKRSNDFLRLPSTKRTLMSWAKRLNALPEDLVVTINGGPNRGTWLHPKIAIAAARWVSEDFECWCDDTINRIATGEKILVDAVSPLAPVPLETSLEPEFTRTEALEIALYKSRALDEARQVIEEVTSKALMLEDRVRETESQ